MNSKLIVRMSNIIGIVSIMLLVYWVFVFISITVFGFKVFRENITETFYLSIIGILALMFGALIINIMFNMTRIAEKHNKDVVLEGAKKKTTARLTFLFLLSFPLLFGLLFGGDYLTSRKKEKMLTASAQSVVEQNPVLSDKLLHYTFDEAWIVQTSEILDLYSKTDKNFPHVSVIVLDTIEAAPAFLGFRDYYKVTKDTTKPKKVNYIRETTKEERDYLLQVFFENHTEVKFSAKDGRYELFYPYIKNGKKIVLYFSDYQRYGKIGS